MFKFYETEIGELYFQFCMYQCYAETFGMIWFLHILFLMYFVKSKQKHIQKCANLYVGQNVPHFPYCISVFNKQLSVISHIYYIRLALGSACITLYI